MAFLPITQAVRQSANDYLAGMAARGFVSMPMEQLVRQTERYACPHGDRLGRCRACMAEHRAAAETIRSEKP